MQLIFFVSNKIKKHYFFKSLRNGVRVYYVECKKTEIELELFWIQNEN